MNKAFKRSKLTDKQKSSNFRYFIKYLDMMSFDRVADKYGNKQQ